MKTNQITVISLSHVQYKEADFNEWAYSHLFICLGVIELELENEATSR